MDSVPTPCQSKADSNKRSKDLLVFCIEISEALIHANNTSKNQRGRPSKRKNVQLTPRGKKPTVPLPITDIRYDRLDHWPVPVTQKNR